MSPRNCYPDLLPRLRSIKDGVLCWGGVVECGFHLVTHAFSSVRDSVGVGFINGRPPVVDDRVWALAVVGDVHAYLVGVGVADMGGPAAAYFSVPVHVVGAAAGEDGVEIAVGGG